MTSRLQGKVTIITGCGRGIGRGCAKRFAAEGAIVLVNDIHAGNAEAVTAEIIAAGGRATAYPADVTNPASVKAMVDHTVTRFGRLDVLFANAGGAKPGPTHETSLEAYHHIIALNLNAVFYGVQAALPVMMRQRSGVFLTTSSGAGLNAAAGLTAYGAAKAGVINMMRNVATEYGQFGIRACSISPGMMVTEYVGQWLDSVPGGQEGIARQVPAGRLGVPEDIASAAVFLASDEASYINGVVLPVDGGVLAQIAQPKIG